MIDIELVDFAEFLADKARAKLLPHFKQEIEIEVKGDSSPVTIADREVEEELRQLIAINYPEHGIFGEEFEDKNIHAEYVWVIDPIDGTKAFIAGRPTFGTLISLMHNGRAEIGIIDQPVLDECWVAYDSEVGLRNKNIKKTISTRRCPNLKDAFFACTSLDMFSAEEAPLVDKIRKECKQNIFGGDCYNYGALAAGKIDVIIESDMKPYDYMALIPIIKNAGGAITDWQGKELALNSSGQVLACGDKELHAKIVAML